MAAVKPIPADKAPDDIKPIFEGMTKNFGKVPVFFGIMAQKPEVLKAFLPLYGAITGPGALDQRYKELAYLKTSMVNGCVYWTTAHTASAKRIGITPDQIKDLTFYRRSNLFDEKDRAVIHYADQLARAATTICERDLEDLRKHFSEEQIVELTLTACVANFTNRFNDAMQCEPDIGV